MLLMLHFVQTVPVRIDQYHILQNWLGIPFSFCFFYGEFRKVSQPIVIAEQQRRVNSLAHCTFTQVCIRSNSSTSW